MLEGFLHLFAVRSWREIATDVVDLFAVAYIAYRVLLVFRGTRAMTMGIGLAIVGLAYGVSRLVGLVTLNNAFSSLISSLILVVVVLFQSDIRRGLARVGKSYDAFGRKKSRQESRVIDEVVAAATELARHRIGAIICLEQDASMDEFGVSAGTTIDSLVHHDLLVNLFIPEAINKLHDGAVVIRERRIHKAGVFFPMPDTRGLDKSLGSRHRAAIGITEETDALVVVVSEERGTIGLCFGGNFVAAVDAAALKKTLLGMFGEHAPTNRKLTSPHKKSPISMQVRAVTPASDRGSPLSGGVPTIDHGGLHPEPPSQPSLPLRPTREPKPMVAARPLETPAPMNAAEISPVAGDKK